MKSIGDNGFLWFLGLVEDIEGDEHKLYRVRVRAFNHHDNTDVKDLPWATVTLPTTSSSFQGASDTPAIAKGALVMGFFLDGESRQLPVVLATLPIFPDKDDKKHTLSMLARGNQIIEKTLTGPEPESAYAAQYPYNRVTTTRSGHVIEVDDSPGAERIHVYHKSGSYVEIHPDGTTVIKSAKDSYDVTTNTKQIFAKEDVKISSNQSVTIVADGMFVNCPGGLVVKGSIFASGAVGSDVGATGSFSTPTGQTIHVVNGLVTKID